MYRYLIFSTLLLCLCVAGQTQSLVLTPKWTAQAQFAGYYAADKLGFYREEGLDLRIVHVTVGESSYSCLCEGRAQVVVMNLSYALMARQEGVRMVNIMQTAQRNSLMLVSHSRICHEDSLRGRQIAVWNHLGSKFLDLLNRRYNLNATWVHFNSGINLFLSGAVDVCLMGSYNEYPQLAEYGVNIDSTCVFRLSEGGYDLPEDGLYVTEAFYEANRELIPRIVRASIRGWQWVNEHREEALDIVMEKVKENNIGTNRYHQRKMLEEILHLQCNKDNGERTYRLSRKDFVRSVEGLFPAGEWPEEITYEDFVK